jgi:catecholate siderophore receptor
MARWKRRPLAAAVFATFWAPEGGAFAQDQRLPEVRVRAAPEEGFKAESTGSATRTETPLRDIPQTINVVPQEVIRSQGATNLGDALRNVPGITYAAPEGGTQANNVYYLRGFPAGGDLFLDGIRDIGEYNRDLFNIEQVEVLKGPSSLMFGRGSTGGIIHQVSKTPTLWNHKEVGLTLGSQDKKRVTADLNLKTGDSNALRINALAEDSGWYRYPQGVEKLGIAPSYRIGIGERTDITLSYYYLKTNDVTDYGQPTLYTSPNAPTNGVGFFGFAPVSPKAYYGFANHDFSEHETNMATARVDHEIDRNLSLRNTLRWASFKRSMEATIATLDPTDANGNPVTRTTPLELLRVNRRHDAGRARDNDDSALVNQTELTWKKATGTMRHTVLGGLELAKEELDRNNYTFTGTTASLTPLLGPDPSTTLAYAKTPNDRSLSEARTVALYGQDQVAFNEHWKALVGLRWERYDAAARQTDIATGAVVIGNDGNPVDFARVDKLVSGRAGLIFQPNPAQSYYASYGDSYNPSGELGVYGGTATNLNAQTELLEPEHTRNFEVGAQWDWRGLQIRGALFRTDKTNARTDIDPGTGTRTALEGERRVEGLEGSVAGHLMPNWELIASIAFMDGEIKSGAGQANLEGKTPLGVPSEAGSLWTVYRFGGGWELGGGAFWSQERWIDDANTAQLPSYVRWDAMLAYVQKKYELRLNVYNLTDELYYYGAYQNSPSRVLPGAPREAHLTLAYRFD